MKKISTEELLKRKNFDTLDKTKITERHLSEISKILEVYNCQTIKNRLKNIHDFIKYDVDGDWLYRINIIRTVLVNDVMSDYSLEIRYGKENVSVIKKELSKKVSHTLEKYLEKYGEVEGKVKWEEFKEKSKTPWGLESCVKKYGECKGKIKWKERLNKKINTQNERKKNKPYRNGRTLTEYQNRYGVKDGYDKWLKRNNKHSYRFSKKYYIETYGDKIGNEKWLEYKLTMNKTSLTSFIGRYGEIEGNIKYKNHITKLFKSGLFYSKISQELFYLIYDKIDKVKHKDIRFAKLNGEEIFYDKINNNTILVDFKCGNKIIEFDGEYWHSKPEQIEKDKLRDNYLISKGYHILRVKESDYKNDKEKIITECLMFLNN